MKIFRVSHITLHYCGILDDKNLSNVLSKFIQSVVILSSTYFVISASMFFVGNISDILTATEGVYLTGAALVTLLLLLDYKLNRHLIYKFIFDLQENINRGKICRCSTLHFYHLNYIFFRFDKGSYSWIQSC